MLPVEEAALRTDTFTEGGGCQDTAWQLASRRSDSGSRWSAWPTVDGYPDRLGESHLRWRVADGLSRLAQCGKSNGPSIAPRRLRCDNTATGHVHVRLHRRGCHAPCCTICWMSLRTLQVQLRPLSWRPDQVPVHSVGDHLPKLQRQRGGVLLCTYTYKLESDRALLTSPCSRSFLLHLGITSCSTCGGDWSIHPNVYINASRTGCGLMWHFQRVESSASQELRACCSCYDSDAAKLSITRCEDG
jgi:hypothetical protein